VLQRIGICYILGALITMRASVKQQVVAAVVLLYGYWFAMTLIPVPGHGIGALMLADKGGSLAAWLDRTIIGPHHMWIGGDGIWDPEGILSSVPATATVILGVLAGQWLGARRPLLERITALFAAGAIGMMVGLVWNWSFPIGKNLWTSSYVVFTAGMACVALATCMWLIDVERVTGWTKPLVIYGVNPIVAFVASGFFSRFIYTLIKVPRSGKLVPLETAIFEGAFAPLFTDPRDASLLFAIAYVVLFFGLLTYLYRRNIILKV
jgi:predicted acyltransferase